MEKPSTKPDNPNFSSGPCAKRPGSKIEDLKNAKNIQVRDGIPVVFGKACNKKGIDSCSIH